MAENQMQPAGMAAQQPQPEQTAGVTGDETGGEVSADEQQIYEMFVKNCTRVMLEKNFFHNLVDLATGQDPVPAVGDAIAALAKQVLNDAEQKGVRVSQDIFIAGMGEVIEVLASDLAEKGVVDLSEEQMAGMLYRATDTLRSQLESEGKIDQEKHSQMLEEYKRMDEAGELEGVFGVGAPKPNRRERRAMASANRKKGSRR